MRGLGGAGFFGGERLLRFRVARPVVVQAEELAPDAAAWLGERCELVVCHYTDAGFREKLAGADGLVVRTYCRVGEELLARGPRLRVVGRAGVGLDHIDVGACRRRGVRVVHTPDANSAAVTEYLFAMLLDALRPRVYLDGPVDAERWIAIRKQARAERELGEMTLGILGLGRIGRRVARAAGALNMRVLYHDLLDIPGHHRHGATAVSREELLSRSDIVSIHVDPRPENNDLVTAADFARMKPDAVLVNTARGRVVNTGALAEWLKHNPRALALLDVHAAEPFDGAYPLLGLANARLSPHLGAATKHANEKMSWVVRDVWRVLNGEEAEWEAEG